MGPENQTRLSTSLTLQTYTQFQVIQRYLNIMGICCRNSSYLSFDNITYFDFLFFTLPVSLPLFPFSDFAPVCHFRSFLALSLLFPLLGHQYAAASLCAHTSHHTSRSSIGFPYTNKHNSNFSLTPSRHHTTLAQSTSVAESLFTNHPDTFSQPDSN